MPSWFDEILEDEELIRRIQSRLPLLFQIAEIESSRAGKIGMEIGSLRERILTALLIHKFGKTNVKTEISITEPEVDVELRGKPISVKTITGSGGVKAVWTVDAQKAREFVKDYAPTCDILLARIAWENQGGLYFIPIEIQQEVLRVLGPQRYFSLPKPGTNPRGVEFSYEAMTRLLSDSKMKSIEILWSRRRLKYQPHERWIEYWSEDNSTFRKKPEVEFGTSDQ